jgi:hypothetical protein
VLCDFTEHLSVLKHLLPVLCCSLHGTGLTARPGSPASVPATRRAAANAEQQATTNGVTGGSSSSSTNLHQPLLKGQQQDVYSLESQASLTLHFCAALNVKQVVLVGHADGCLVVVHAAALAKQRRLQSEHHHHTGQQSSAAGSSAAFMQPLMQQTTPSPLERYVGAGLSWWSLSGILCCCNCSMLTVPAACHVDFGRGLKLRSTAVLQSVWHWNQVEYMLQCVWPDMHMLEVMAPSPQRHCLLCAGEAQCFTALRG